MPTKVFLFLRPLPSGGTNYRGRHAFGPQVGGGFETDLSIEINAQQLAPFASALAAVDGKVRCIPLSSIGILVLEPSPAAQVDLIKTLGTGGQLVFVYRHLDRASVAAAAEATIQALGSKAFPSGKTTAQLGTDFANGDFWLSVRAGTALGQASTVTSVPGWATLGFEIVYVPGGLATGGGTVVGTSKGWLRLQDIIHPTALTRRLDPLAFYATMASSSGPAKLDASHAGHVLLTLPRRRTLIEIRDEHDDPYTDPVTIQKGTAAAVTAPPPAGSRGIFVLDTVTGAATPSSETFRVSIPGHLFSTLPSGVSATAVPVRMMEAPAHWPLQTIFMSATPSATDEPKSWFVANTSVLPRFTENNKVTPLRDGIVTFREYAEAIGTLTAPGHFMYLAGWILIDNFELIAGAAGSTFQALTTLVTSPLRSADVRAMLYDDTNLAQNFPFVGQGNINNGPRNRINALPGGHGRAILDDEVPGFSGSHHQKFLVINGSKGALAFCGGMDINTDRRDSDNHGALGAFHDVHAKVEGPAVADIHQTFVERWNTHPVTTPATRIPTAAPPFKPSAGTHYVQVARTFSPAYTRRGHYPFVAAAGTMPAGSLTPLRAIRRAIQKAKHYIYIEDQYLTPYAGTAPGTGAGDTIGVLTDLRAALSRIDYLIIVVPNRCDQPQNVFRREQFLAALHGVAPLKVYVFFLARSVPGTSPGPGELAVEGGCPACSGGAAFPGEIYCHSKVWIVDDVCAKIGSANLNRRSMTSDSEMDIVVVDAAVENGARVFARQLRMDLWGEHLNLRGASRALLEDVGQAVELFKSPPPGARIRPYTLTATGGAPAQALWDGPIGSTVAAIDPDDQ